MRENWPNLKKSAQLAVKEALSKKSNLKKLLRWFSFVIAPAFGLLGILFCWSLEFGYWRDVPNSVQIMEKMFLLLLFCALVLLYIVFITMITTWDIDRISYTVEEEAQRQFLKRISPEKQKPSDADQGEVVKADAGGASPKLSVALDRMIARRAEFLWQQLLQSGCIDFPKADVKLAIRTIREEHHVDNTGILDALKTMVVSTVFARRYIPCLRLKIMDKLVFRFVREVSLLFISVLLVVLATVLLWSNTIPDIFSTKPDAISVSLFVADLTLRGAIFTIVDHLGLTLTHLAPRGEAKMFIAYTLAFRLFMSVFVIATITKLLKLALRRKLMGA